MAINRSKIATPKSKRLHIPGPALAPVNMWKVMEAARVLDTALQDDLDSIIEVAEARRRGYLNRLRDALECGDERGVYFYARRLCGVPEPQTHPQKVILNPSW